MQGSFHMKQLTLINKNVLPYLSQIITTDPLTTWSGEDFSKALLGLTISGKATVLYALMNTLFLPHLQTSDCPSIPPPCSEPEEASFCALWGKK